MKNPAQLYLPLCYLLSGYCIGAAGAFTSILLYTNYYTDFYMYISLSIMAITILILAIISFTHYVFWKKTAQQPLLQIYE